MTDSENERLRTQLLERKRDAESELHRHLTAERDAATPDVGDLLEQTDAGSQSEIDLALLQMRTQTVSHLNEALARVEAGEYGVCLDCGAPIPDVRLSALPFAVRCRTCADHQERRTGHNKGAVQQPDRPFPFTPAVGP